MWFRNHSHEDESGKPHSRKNPEGYLITPDMLIRGTVSMRRGKPIRQMGVTVQGSTVLVTTGDIVDQETYDALVALGAIASPHAPTAPEKAQG
mgnify:CR=1 FL=1